MALVVPQPARRSTPTAVFFAACAVAVAIFHSGLSFCNAVQVVCTRGSRIVMHGGQSGRFNFGQQNTGQLKSTKKRHTLRPRKQYGSHSARKMPRRYELYDKLEEYDETLPYFTIISEPDEPEEATENVPLSERYAWAGDIKWHPKKLEENKRLEPLFGSSVWQNLKPMTRRQKWEGQARKGQFPSHNYPKWAYEPDWQGLRPSLPKDLEWESDRRVKAEYYSEEQLELISKMPKEKIRNMHPSVQAAIDELSELESED
mmetsp:Transcript_73112/g.136666  ORF Transcript_73112/g.136666 Transcript_73112/m.136666 type:complete len:259 (-) Transcript_73112:35-811(-)